MTRGVATAQDVDEAARAERITDDATKAPIVLARRIVERHIQELRFRHLIEVPPHTASLLLTLEQLTHDIASAILDARKAPRISPATEE